MATELLKTVTPAGQGGDYNTLEAALHANEQNLVANDKYLNIAIGGDWTGVTDDTLGTIHNYTVDATRRIHIYTTGDAVHDGTAYKASAYKRRARLNIGGGGNYLIIDDLIWDHNDAGVVGIAEAGALTSPTYNRCIFYNGGVSDYGIAVHASSTGLITNCQFFDIGRGITCASASLTTAYNCTVQHAGAYGIYRVLAKNCFVGGSAAACYLSLVSGSSNNVSSDTTGNVTLKTAYSSYFVSIAAGAQDYHLLGPSATVMGASGTDLSAAVPPLSLDIDGGTRATWDIGCDEYGSPSGNQFARPIADVSLGLWSDQASGTTDIFESINEIAAADADYVQSDATPSADEAIFTLTALYLPEAGTVTMRIRAKVV